MRVLVCGGRDFDDRDFVFRESNRVDWGVHGSAAGPIRNQQMLDDGKPDVEVLELAP